MEQIEDRIAINNLVNKYAIETDRKNQDSFREIFSSDVRLKIYYGEKLGFDVDNIDSLVSLYKSFGPTKASFHHIGQHSVDFIDENHAVGVSYAMVTIVKEGDGKEKILQHGVRYEDKYLKKDGRWWISEREQHFVYSH